ncbi:MAG TPA: hypothetical protein VGD13_08735, partial [Xanthobacteraceae bacterium]
MIDPPKATKGRRMSKKTRKKSPKTPAGKVARPRSGASAKKPAAKTAKAAAKKSSKSAAKPPAKTSAKESHKAPSKPLKPISPSESVVPVVAASKASAPKPLVATPPTDKTPTPKTVAAA